MNDAADNSTGRTNVTGKPERFIRENPTKENGIEIPSLHLPKGGGALKGIDEKFQVNPSNGTASLQIPLPSSPGRNGFGPSLSLSYNSGTGNGPFGLGWDVSLPAIQRRTSKNIPQYRNDNPGDVFMFTGMEDLVPFLREGAGGVWTPEESTHGSYQVKRYRPRLEGAFSKIERIEHPSLGMYWKVTTKDNLVTFFGRKKENRIADPANDTRIFTWLPEFTYDDKGNWMSYEYKADTNLLAAERDLIPSALHERNRKNGKALFLQQYIKRISYGNHLPYYAEDSLPFDPPGPVSTEHFFELVFDYGEHNHDKPVPMETPGMTWPYRPDAFSNYHAGFEIRTARLCQRILMFHHFNNEETFGVDYLVRSLDLNYAPSSINNSGFFEVSYLSGLTQSGYIRLSDGSYSKKSLPEFEFEYQQLVWNKEIKVVSNASLVHAPTGIMDEYQWTDFFGEGVPGIFSEQNQTWYYKNNLGTGTNGELLLSDAEIIAPKPNFSGMKTGTVQFQDLEADGSKQLVVDGLGYFELTDDNKWESFRPFGMTDQLKKNDRYRRMLDLTGDGRPDLVITEDNVFVWYESAGKKGRLAPVFAEKFFEEEKGPAIVFADMLETIFLADMNGDGLQDIVRIRNGDICYWPNMGYGKFGAKVNMSTPPVFDRPDAFSTAHIHLADISGTGPTDILYTGKNSCKAYLNLSGNAWSAGEEIETFPPLQQASQLAVIDLLSTGTASLVWSSDLPAESSLPMKYIDLMSSRKPHVMTGQINNMGKEVSIEYKSSAFYFLEDKKAGRPWITKLPFPVQVVSRTTLIEKISQTSFSTSYQYHHGYFDHAEKEFRGFGCVDQLDSESYENWKLNAMGTKLDDSEPLFQKPVLTKTWFHTGAYLYNKKIGRCYETEYWYNEIKRQGFAVITNEPSLPEALIETSEAILDKSILSDLSGFEWREIARACKGMVLRQEVFALDAPLKDPAPAERQQQLTPYTVTMHNYRIVIVQPRKTTPYMVLMTGETESFTVNYERNADDPRISQMLQLNVNEYNQPLESATIVYPRRVVDLTLPVVTQESQSKIVILYSQSVFTNDNLSDTYYRLRQLAESASYELKGLTKTGDYYESADFESVLTKASNVPYAAVNTEPTAGTSQKRLIEQVRKTYLKNDLSGSLPLNKLESLALPYENYQLAYTPELLTDIYAIKADDPTLTALMTEGKYFHPPDGTGNPDPNWWIRSGTMQFLFGTDTPVDARNRFYIPLSFIDAFGNPTDVNYYKDYYLFIQETTDALGNTSGVDVFNFRTLSPQRLRDINNNMSESIADELGFIKATALFGKGADADDLSGLSETMDPGEAALIGSFFNETNSVLLVTEARNLLRHATVRFLYDFDNYKTSGKPAVVASIIREEYFSKNNDSPLQISFEYSNGNGQSIMKKMQAEPGMAKKIILNPDNSFTVTQIDTSASIPAELRWIGNGRTILNNKGNPVKQYEPYFSVSPAFEDQQELVEKGVTPIMFYDPLGRLIQTLMPDGTLTRVSFDAWRQFIFDASDTLLTASWYLNRTGHLIDAQLIAAGKDPVKEKEAADQAVKHAGTPTQLHLDTLGHPILSIDHNKDLITSADIFFQTILYIDPEGNPRTVTDARGNKVASYKYDMLGHRAYQNQADSGQRWQLANILGHPLRTWDERNQEFQFSYDALHRPSSKTILGGDGKTPLNHIYERVVYGESLLLADKSNRSSLQADNVFGQAVKHFDTGGLLLTPQFDIKAKSFYVSRQLYKNYKSVANWTDPNMVSDLETPVFTIYTERDALERIQKQTMPDGSIITPTYNRTGLLNGETVVQSGTASTDECIKDIQYNEKGQRIRIIYGNDVSVDFIYDALTFRLQHLTSKRKNNDPLQDLYYTQDAVGNITHIEDKNIPLVFYDNSKTDGVSAFTYDALYRLISATGRENNVSLVFDAKDNTGDELFIMSPDLGSPLTLRPYLQTYQYDAAGNLVQMKHSATGNNWTRDYNNNAINNRLISTQVGVISYAYQYHPQHGFITQMPHLSQMNWTFKEELASTSTQIVNPGNGVPEITYYQYDGQGQRLRKITETSAAAGVLPLVKEERIYISEYETYRKYASGVVQFERATLSLIDAGKRFMMIERVIQNNQSSIPDPVNSRLFRYQFQNHIGSCTLELDATAQVISYEEYHPFGTTSFQANNKALKAAQKRYRFTGMERDEETGLEYHSARYYITWLGRWLSPDPTGIKNGLCVYAYVSNNPIDFMDPDGRDDTDPQKKRELSSWEMVKLVAGMTASIVKIDLIQAGAPEWLVETKHFTELGDARKGFLSTQGVPFKEPEDDFGKQEWKRGTDLGAVVAVSQILSEGAIPPKGPTPQFAPVSGAIHPEAIPVVVPAVMPAPPYLEARKTEDKKKEKETKPAQSESPGPKTKSTKDIEVIEDSGPSTKQSDQIAGKLAELTQEEYSALIKDPSRAMKSGVLNDAEVNAVSDAIRNPLAAYRILFGHALERLVGLRVMQDPALSKQLKYVTNVKQMKPGGSGDFVGPGGREYDITTEGQYWRKVNEGKDRTYIVYPSQASVPR